MNVMKGLTARAWFNYRVSMLFDIFVITIVYGHYFAVFVLKKLFIMAGHKYYSFEYWKCHNVPSNLIIPKYSSLNFRWKTKVSF